MFHYPSVQKSKLKLELNIKQLLLRSPLRCLVKQIISSSQMITNSWFDYYIPIKSNIIKTHRDNRDKNVILYVKYVYNQNVRIFLGYNRNLHNYYFAKLKSLTFSLCIRYRVFEITSILDRSGSSSQTMFQKKGSSQYSNN